MSKTSRTVELCRCKKPATHIAILLTRGIPVCKVCVNELISPIYALEPIVKEGLKK